MQATNAQLKKLFYISMALVLNSCAHKEVGRLEAKDNPFVDKDNSTPLEWAQKQNLLHFRLLFAGNVNGQLEPCGCAVNPKGGLDRRLNFVRREAQFAEAETIPLLIVDAGNALFPTKELDSGQAEFQKKRAEAVFKGHKAMGVMAQHVSHLDFAAGWPYLKQLAAKNYVPLVSTNLVDSNQKALFPTEQKIKLANGAEVVVLGVSSAADSFPRGVSALEPVAALQSKLREIAQSTAVVVLSDLGASNDRELVKKLSRPVIVVGGRDLSSLDIPYHDGNSLIVQSQLQGQQWGVVTFAWNPTGKAFYNRKIAANFERRWGDLETSWKDQRAKRQPSAIADMNQVTNQLLAYAPGDLSQKIVYDYRLVDLTLEYAQHNELSPLVKELKQKK